MPTPHRMHLPQRMSAPRRMNAPNNTMFPHMVTVYNVSVETDRDTLQSKVTNHITILRGVLLDETKAVNVRSSGLEGADAVNLYIPFNVKAVDGLTGKEKGYMPPIEFWRAEDKSGAWTLAISNRNASGDGYTFFVKGESLPPEGTKPELVADIVEAAFDGVYHITKIDTKDFGSPDMMHWEVGGV